MSNLTDCQKLVSVSFFWDRISLLAQACLQHIAILLPQLPKVLELQAWLPISFALSVGVGCFCEAKTWQAALSWRWSGAESEITSANFSWVQWPSCTVGAALTHSRNVLDTAQGSCGKELCMFQMFRRLIGKRGLKVRFDSKTNRISKEKFLCMEKLLVTLEQGHFPKLDFSRENLAFITNNTTINYFPLCD